MCGRTVAWQGHRKVSVGGKNETDILGGMTGERSQDFGVFPKIRSDDNDDEDDDSDHDHDKDDGTQEKSAGGPAGKEDVLRLRFCRRKSEK